MAQVPVIVHVGVMSVLAPLGTSFLRRRRLTPPQFWVFIWLVLWAFMNITGYIVGRLHYNNHFLTYVFTPFQGAAILWALSLYQVHPVARVTMRITIPIFVVAWALALPLIENVNNFSLFAEPVYSILALGAAVFTLASRGSEATEPVQRQDWFWICAGLALYFAALTLLLPLSATFVYSRPDIVIRAYLVNSVVSIVAFACIANGFLCTAKSIPSGSFSSPAAAV